MWGRNTDLFGLHPIMLGWVQLLAGVREGAVEAGAGKPAPRAFGVAAQVAHKCLLPVQHMDGPHSTQTWLMVAVATPDTVIAWDGTHLSQLAVRQNSHSTTWNQPLFLSAMLPL